MHKNPITHLSVTSSSCWKGNLWLVEVTRNILDGSHIYFGPSPASISRARRAQDVLAGLRKTVFGNN